LFSFVICVNKNENKALELINIMFPSFTNRAVLLGLCVYVCVCVSLFLFPLCIYNKLLTLNLSELDLIEFELSFSITSLIAREESQLRELEFSLGAERDEESWNLMT